MGLIQKYKDWREYEKRSATTLEQILLEANIGVDSVTKEQALNIPSVAGAVDIICNIVASLPIHLYKEVEGKLSIADDERVNLLNDDTKDTLDAFQFKKALVEDYLLSGAGYAYIHKDKNKVKSLHYVDNDNVSVIKNTDPIFKDCTILVNGKSYLPFEFIKLTRKTKDGVSGRGIIDEHNDILTVAYLTMRYEKILLRTGGNKKGFIRAEKKLSEDAMTALKTAWNNLYKDNTDNVVILNDGLDFKEASSSSVEMQMNENKQTNSSEIDKILNIPAGIWDGTNANAYSDLVKLCIMPVVKALETALNKDLLLEIEKKQYYFAADTKELLKGNMLDRFKAYEIAIKNGFLQWDEVRYIEDYEPYNLDFIKLGLQDVLYNVKTREVYTPNTDKTTKLNGKGGDNENESGNQK